MFTSSTFQKCQDDFSQCDKFVSFTFLCAQEKETFSISKKMSLVDGKKGLINILWFNAMLF